ncbi:MAG: carboxypeptidase-like regulatory domain-containing protein [Vicinamibacterales bacterium]
MRKLVIAIACAALGATSSGLLAQSGSLCLAPPPLCGVKLAQPSRPAGIGGDTMIIGTVIDSSRVPVACAKVQLRSLTTGVVLQEGESNALGEYEFVVDTPGTYIVEMVTVEGYVVAVSNAGSLARFETLRTLVQLPGLWNTQLCNIVMPQNTTGFLRLSAQSTMTSATLNLALAMNIAPVNSGEPVSATATFQ